MTTNRKAVTSFGLHIERFAPIACAMLSFFCLLFLADSVAAKFASKEWKSAGLYSAIFGWSAIQTGFAFGVYGFVIGKSGGFVVALKGTVAMARFMGYIWRANITGFALTVASIPLIIGEPRIENPLSLNYVVVSLWFALFVWSFLAFLRLAYNFGKLSSVEDKEFHGA